MDQREYQDLLEKYKSRVASEFGGAAPVSRKIATKEYTDFKRELYPGQSSQTQSRFSKSCVDAEKSGSLSS